MTESVKMGDSEMILEAEALIEAIPNIFGLSITEGNLLNILYLVYGLNDKQAKILIETSKGKVLKGSKRVIEKAKSELYKFLSSRGKIVIIEIFFESGTYEFRTA